jgi:hypothetical protein
LFQCRALTRAVKLREHYVFVIHQRGRNRSTLIQWNFAILMYVMLSDFPAAGVADLPARRNPGETEMNAKAALIFATTAAIALGGFDLRPAAAAPEGGPAVVKQKAGADELSSQRRRRGRGAGVPLAAFGALIGTIGAIAAANSRRDAYYGGGPYYYAEPQYVPGPSYYAAPQPYVRHHHYAPAPRHYAPAARHHGGHHAPGPRQYPLGSFQGGPRGGSPHAAPPAAANDGRL